MLLFVLILAEKAEDRCRDIHERCHLDLRFCGKSFSNFAVRRATSLICSSSSARGEEAAIERVHSQLRQRLEPVEETALLGW